MTDTIAITDEQTLQVLERSLALFEDGKKWGKNSMKQYESGRSFPADENDEVAAYCAMGAITEAINQLFPQLEWNGNYPVIPVPAPKQTQYEVYRVHNAIAKQAQAPLVEATNVAEEWEIMAWNDGKRRRWRQVKKAWLKAIEIQKKKVQSGATKAS